jgi:predicted unusual protein kinase regulating ubiquinone biosynthesis (AarF/ABC1/UbiB family)
MTSLLKISYLRLKYRYFPDEAQAFWGQELLESQGLGAKVGQLLSQGKVTALPKSTVSRLEAQKIFSKFFHQQIAIEHEALAASMGQVFHARMGDVDLALKILHPGIRKKLKKEIDNILVLGKYFSKIKGFTFDQLTFHRFLTDTFQEETDLLRESLSQDIFHGVLKDDERFLIPKVLREFSNDEILAQEWIPATLARDLQEFPNLDIFHFYFKTLLSEQILHGDLNDRNWGFNSANKVVVYDFGCSQNVSDRRINGLKKLILNQDVKNAFLEFGVRLEATWFKGKEQELRNALFDPLFGRPILADWSYSKDLEEAFGDKIKLLREFTDPWVLLMMRSLFSLIRLYQSRGVTIHLGDSVKPYLRFKKLKEKEVEIHIEVSSKGSQVFFIQLPFTSLKDLDLHIPVSVQNKINVKDLLLEVSKRGAVSQELFDVLVEQKRYRIWVE